VSAARPGPAAPAAPGGRSGWLRDERDALAAERILDAAARLFVAQGVAATGMADVARAAGCSRATLYRYFENRDELRTAYVHRAARRIGAGVADGVAGIADPTRRLVEAVLDAVDRVRGDPTLAVWFGPGDNALASSMARSSAVIETMVAAFLGDAADVDTTARARWVVRVVVSLLALPGADRADERRLLERFVAPVVLAPAAPASAGDRGGSAPRPG
jgi:AcrR family transcriptional regulator